MGPNLSKIFYLQQSETKILFSAILGLWPVSTYFLLLLKPHDKATFTNNVCIFWPCTYPGLHFYCGKYRFLLPTPKCKRDLWRLPKTYWYIVHKTISFIYFSTNSARIFQVFSSLTVNIARPQCVQFIYLVIQPISTVVTIIVVPKVSVQGVKSLWGNCWVFFRLCTGDTDRWRIKEDL